MKKHDEKASKDAPVLTPKVDAPKVREDEDLVAEAESEPLPFADEAAEPKLHDDTFERKVLIPDEIAAAEATHKTTMR